jgi:predicted Zn-dependent protease with MMP-like domain
MGPSFPLYWRMTLLALTLTHSLTHSLTPLLTLMTIISSQIYARFQSVTQRVTHYVSGTKPNRLILFRETVTVYCENHTEHTKYINIQSVPHRKHYVSATKPNRLILFRETVTVYCENHTEHTYTLWDRMRSFDVLKKVVHVLNTGI